MGIVSFLKQAKIPSFPMQPFLEELYPAAPTGIATLLPQTQAQTQNHPLPPQTMAPPTHHSQPLPVNATQLSSSPSTEGMRDRGGSLSPARGVPQPPPFSAP